MTSPAVVLEKEGKERWLSVIKADTDPTVNPPEFTFTAGTDRPEEIDWVAGAWEGDASGSGTSWTARALTPLVGFTGSGAEIELAVGKFTPWFRVLIDDELLVRPLAKITVKG